MSKMYKTETSTLPLSHRVHLGWHTCIRECGRMMLILKWCPEWWVVLKCDAPSGARRLRRTKSTDEDNARAVTTTHCWKTAPHSAYVDAHSAAVQDHSWVQKDNYNMIQEKEKHSEYVEGDGLRKRLWATEQVKLKPPFATQIPFLNPIRTKSSK